MVLTSAPKLIKLWISTKIAGNILSGNFYKKDINLLYKISGIKVSKLEIINFPKILQPFLSHINKCFRGVFHNDIFYTSLIKNKKAKTLRYYSCSKNINVAKVFGNKIILIFENVNIFDISKFSKEEEVIISKNLVFKLKNSFSTQGYTFHELILDS
jgi:hypothetical protein